MKKKSILFLLFTAMLMAGACRKESDTVPNVPVDFYVNTTDPNFVALNAVGGWVYVTGGAQGIVIYRKSQTEFMAYDRNCTYKASSGKRLFVDTSTNLFLQDSDCGSKFLITDGSVQNGPASVPLKHYTSTFDGVMIHVYN